MEHSPHRVNYDLIAHLYDEPERDYEPDVNLVRYIAERSKNNANSFHVLDMGCGTGKQLTANHKKYPEIEMVGLDRFSGMLVQARQRCPEISWIQGDSTQTFIESNYFDYITNQFSYHHIHEKSKLLSETYRILKPGGRFVITNLDPWSMQNWIVYQYFPASKKRDFEDFLPSDKLIRMMDRAGFTNISHKLQAESKEVSLREFLDYASLRHRTSQLMVISDKQYFLGIKKLKDSIDKFGGEFRIFSETCLITVTGDKG